jgi:hypothetical protein
MPDLEYVSTDDTPLSDLTIERAIALRWTLRDIVAGRTKFLPLADGDLRLLLEMGMVEMRDGEPKLTEAGFAVVE